MIRDTREARGAIKFSGGGSQPLPDRDQLRTSRKSLAKEEATPVPHQNPAESLSATIETLSQRVSGTKSLPQVASGRTRRRDRMRTGIRAPWPPTGTGRAIVCPKEKGKGKMHEWRKGHRHGKRPHLQRVRRDWTLRKAVRQ